jgi:hypothetical protein
MLFSASYIKSPEVIIIRDDIKDALDISKLKDLKVPAIRNYAIGTLLRQAHPRQTFTDMPDVISALKWVSFGSLDAFIVNLAMACHATEANSTTSLGLAGDAGPVLRWRFAVRSDGLILGHSINKALGLITTEEHYGIYKNELRWSKMISGLKEPS